MDQTNKHTTGETKNQLKCRRNIYRHDTNPFKQNQKPYHVRKRSVRKEKTEPILFIYLFI